MPMLVTRHIKCSQGFEITNIIIMGHVTSCEIDPLLNISFLCL